VTSPLMERARSPVLCTLPLRSPHSPLIGAEVEALLGDAAAAGFAGASVCVTHPAWGMPEAAVADRFVDGLAQAPVAVGVAEVLNVDLWGRGDPRACEQAFAAQLDLCARLGAATVNTIAYQDTLPPLAQAGANLARVCDLAAARGLSISFEFLPFSGVAGIRSAAALLEATDRDNLGLVLDLWHWTRSPEGQDIAALRAIPPERIHVLQLCDAPARPAADLVRESVTARLLPGEGDAGIPAVLAALDDMGAAPVVSSEVFSDALVAAGPADNARRQLAALRAAFERHRTARR
jgi:sugar phosphate isomerase/epimerase